MNREMFKPLAGHIALFFSPAFQLQELETALKIKKELGNVFSVTPSTVPFPPGAPIPTELPRIVLQGDPAGQITVSLQRADMAINFNDRQLLDNSLSDHIFKFASCFEGSKVVRIGFILQFDLVEEDIVSVIKNRYICNGKLAEAKELYVGWLKKLSIQGLQANRLVNFSCNSFPEPSGRGRLVVDTNTITETELDLKADDIKRFVEECIIQYEGDLGEFIE